jgi:DNA polymerase-1
VPSLAAQLGITRDEAEKLMEGYFAQFPGVQKFVQRVHRQVVRDGYVDDLFGRRRYLADAQLRRPHKQYGRMTQAEWEVVRKIGSAKRKAQNFVIQGAAATITKLAMLRCHRHIRAEDPGVKMILQVHDELHFEVPEAEVDHFAGELPALMCDLGLERFGVEVPMSVKVQTGPSWGELETYEGDHEDDEA